MKVRSAWQHCYLEPGDVVEIVKGDPWSTEFPGVHGHLYYVIDYSAVCKNARWKLTYINITEDGSSKRELYITPDDLHELLYSTCRWRLRASLETNRICTWTL